MYLIIDETNETLTCEELTQDLLDAADANIIDIISISGNQPQQRIKNGWYGINRYVEGEIIND
tara:strand:+ start:3237 stop:3425 length:189 start_codon:yes stop_codon:yes gene_type:complete